MDSLPFDPTLAQSHNSVSGLNKAQFMARNAMTDEKAREAAQEFEAVFITQMLESMYSGLEPDPVFGGGNAEKIFRSMINEKTAQNMAKMAVLDWPMLSTLKSFVCRRSEHEHAPDHDPEYCTFCACQPRGLRQCSCQDQ